MGTMLYAMGVPVDQCFEALNLRRPALVAEVHRRYVEAGARLLETNTFGANADRLARHGHDGEVREINLAAVRLARDAAQGRGVFVAGAIGPLTPASTRAGGLACDEKRRLFREQASALAEGGADLLIIETFTDLATLRLAYEGARECCDLPIVAQMAFLERSGSFSGDEPVASLTEMWRMGADVVGINCGRGPRLILEILEDFAPRTGHPLSAFFNAGSPDLVEGRYMYLSQPGYHAEMAARMVDAGVNLVGGCCGTTPEVIAAIVARLGAKRIRARPKVPLPAQPKVEADAHAVLPPGLLDGPDSEPSVIAELDPPRGLAFGAVVEGAARLREAGIDLVSVAENPLASPRMGNLAMAVLMKRHAGVEPLVHFTCRDRNLIGLQSDIMGAAALGLQYILCITGDPVPFAGEFGAKGVYDVTSFGLIRMVAGLNRGVNAAGASIQVPARLRIGVAFNSNVRHLHTQVERLQAKLGLGARFALTQPCWDPERIAEIYRQTSALPVQLYMGVMPFVSERNAEFLHNEVPGMTVPEEVRARMKGLSGAEGRRAGIRIAEELLDAIAGHSSRAYVITPFNHYETTAHLVEYFHARVRARRRG